MRYLILTVVFLTSLNLLASGGGGGSGGGTGGASSRSQESSPKAVHEARERLRERIRNRSVTSKKGSANLDADYSGVTKLLSRSVKMKDGGKKSVVNYKAISSQEINQLSQKLLAVSEKQVMKELNPKQRLAYFINLYNVMTIKFIKDNYKLIKSKNNSIKDVGSLFKSSWDRKFFTLFGKKRTLNDIEHGYIRGDKSGFSQSKKEYSDPRIHFAVNCASKGCPALLNESFTEENLDLKLQVTMVNFLKDRSRNHVSKSKKKLVLSPIFKWYKDDFSRGLSGYKSLEDFAAQNAEHLADNEKDIKLIKSKKLKIDFSNYDWTLNDAT